jgi:lysophospholipase L1-like esterase
MCFSRWFRLMALALVLLLAPLIRVTAQGGQADGQYSAAARAIYYIGRVQRGDNVIWSWPGTGVRVRYSASQSVGLRFRAENFPEPSSNNVPRLVWYRIDETPWQSFIVPPGADSVFPLASPGDLGEHSLQVVKASEGRLTFGGIALQAGGKLTGADIPARRIEIVGDSISAGFRVNGGGSYDVVGDHDARASYGWLLGDMLGAEVRLIAITGHGLVHDYDTPPDASTPMPLYYPHLGRDLTSSNNWSWQPGLIIVNLGTNDISSPVTPPDVFRAAYTRLLLMLRARNPAARILALQPFGVDNGKTPIYPEEIKAAVKARRDGGDERVFYGEITGWLGVGDFTDGAHPNAQGQRRAAERLLPLIRELMSWSE